MFEEESDSQYLFLYSYVRAMAWNSTGTAIAYARFDVSPPLEGSRDELIVLNPQTQQVIWRVQEIDRHFELLRWIDNDSLILSVNAFGQVAYYDATTGIKLADFQLKLEISQADVDPTDTLVALAGIPYKEKQPFVEVYDIKHRSLLRSFDLPNGMTPSWLGWHPDGQHFLVLTYDGEACLYNMLDTRNTWSTSFRYLPDKVSACSTGCWIDDGKHIAIGIHSPKFDNNYYYPPIDASLYDWMTGSRILEYPASPGILGFATCTTRDLLAGDGNYFTKESGYQEIVRVWSGREGKFIATLRPYDRVATLAWSTQGKLALGHTVDYRTWRRHPYYRDVTIVNI